MYVELPNKENVYMEKLISVLNLVNKNPKY